MEFSNYLEKANNFSCKKILTTGYKRKTVLELEMRSDENVWVKYTEYLVL